MELVFHSRCAPVLGGIILTVLMSLGIQSSFGSSITIELRPKNPKEGDTLTLTVAFGDSIQSVTWYRGSQNSENVILVYEPSGNSQTPGPQFTGREKGLPSGSLQISNILRNDSANYIILMVVPERSLKAEIPVNVSGGLGPKDPTQGYSGGSTQQPTQGYSGESTRMPIWALILVIIAAVIAVTLIIIAAVFLYKRCGGRKMVQKGNSASNDLTKGSSYYENVRQRNQMPYPDLKYTTSSIYEELQW
ncbi:uncharacterized protein LOC115075976 isoform X2 [Rhinatrema bivittatum]|uniref:uncharacterized protein LOC115075976 isoform X2 n=1 Tax=Rhinatrema bivittatum TaxID=194408 RepID=UPI00112D4FC0|nr:uncharacterized protein LOC115075976 isoform X2 [Rhinatrema bivittatum]